MSGTNTLIQSENAMNKGSESSLTSCLENANEEAIRIMDSKYKNPVSQKEKYEKNK